MTGSVTRRGGEQTRRTGGRILVDALKIHGVDTAFCVPGESFLPVLDALHDARDTIRLIVCRQEGGAGNMAEAYGKLTGRPGICFVTRGPGGMHASIAVHTASQDSTPMILFIGQVATRALGREAFQEVDYRHVFGHIAKWVGQIDRADRIPEMVSRAFHLAVSGRPGPVVLMLPEDMLSAAADVADAGPYRKVQAHPGAGDMARLRDMLEQAARPLMLIGGGGWDAAACADIQSFAAANELPVASVFRRQDLFDNRLDGYIGCAGFGIDPQLAQRIQDADLILAVGPRLGEVTTRGYTLIDIPRPRQKLIHVHAGADELGHVYQGDLLINSGMAQFAAAARALTPIGQPAWREWTAAARADYVTDLNPGPMPGDVDFGAIMVWLREQLPADTIVANGAGNYAVWVHRFYQYTGFRTQLAPTSGAMGYGVPAAVAAKLVHPERPVVCFAGDGCFLMHAQELATAAQYGAAVIFIVVNNGIYGSIRMHQERHYPGRVYGTGIANPDFPALAAAYGAHGERVTRTADFASAFERARQAGRSALIELRIDPDAISPRTTLSAIRSQALAAQRA
ncbi:MAG TPA: thiamine pyrophosphate-binding protein [Burkholderiales bacterium]|jgi:acetolactate synthase-1/2/3 large subunit|nr:thiamine pyrophosphate-binding protein [Burkholderiales bacterium]